MVEWLQLCKCINCVALIEWLKLCKYIDWIKIIELVVEDDTCIVCICGIEEKKKV